MRLIDLTGKKFGRLTVIRRDINYKTHTKWLCKCECGRETIVQGASLKNRHTQSCGCLHNELLGNRKRLNSGLASMRGLMRRYENNGGKRGHTFKLTEKQFEKITQQNCYYCGAKPNNIFKFQAYNGNYIFNGIDRIDNTKDYTIDNVVPCCKFCNYAKRDLTIQEFRDWIKRIYNKMFKKGVWIK